MYKEQYEREQYGNRYSDNPWADVHLLRDGKFSKVADGEHGMRQSGIETGKEGHSDYNAADAAEDGVPGSLTDGAGDGSRTVSEETEPDSENQTAEN